MLGVLYRYYCYSCYCQKEELENVLLHGSFSPETPLLDFQQAREHSQQLLYNILIHENMDYAPLFTQ